MGVYKFPKEMESHHVPLRSGARISVAGPADHLGSQEETTGLCQQWLYGMVLSAVSPLGNRGYERAVAALCGSTYLLYFHLVGLKGTRPILHAQ